MSINPKSVEFHQCHGKPHSICFFFFITISKITKEILPRFVANRPLSRGGHFESQGNKKLCFCPSSLALNERLDGHNLLFQHCVIKFYWKHRLGLESARAALCKWATCTRQTFLSKTFAKSLNIQKQYEKNVWEKSNDAYSFYVFMFFTTISTPKKMFSFRARAEKGIARHIDASGVVGT